MQIYVTNHIFLFRVEAFTFVTLKVFLSVVKWRSLVEVHRILEVGRLLPASAEWQVWLDYVHKVPVMLYHNIQHESNKPYGHTFAVT